MKARDCRKSSFGELVPQGPRRKIPLCAEVFGENSRVLAWIFGRCDGAAEAVETAIGYVPAVGNGADSAGLQIDGVKLPELLKVDDREWGSQLDQVRAHFGRFGAKLPKEFPRQMAALEQRLGLVPVDERG